MHFYRRRDQSVRLFLNLHFKRVKSVKAIGDIYQFDAFAKRKANQLLILCHIVNNLRLNPSDLLFLI